MFFTQNRKYQKIAYWVALFFIVAFAFFIFKTLFEKKENIPTLNSPIEKKENISWEKNKTKEIHTDIVSDYIENLWWDEKTIISNFWDVFSSWNLIQLHNSLQKNNYNEAKIIISSMLKDPALEKNTEAIPKIIALKYIKIWAILNKWNYFYEEETSSKEAIELLEEIKKTHPSIASSFYSNYYLGYAKEIIKDFSWALNSYNAWLSIKNLDSQKTSLLLNQIGHVYDLKWELWQAYEYYYKAYNLNKQNYASSLNIARYLVRKWKYAESKEFLNNSLRTSSNSLKAEIYYMLSEIELKTWTWSDSIWKSLDYANKSIESFPDYPMWYIGKAFAYYLYNDSKYNSQIEENLLKGIQLNPNSYLAYRYYALYLFDSFNFHWASSFLSKSNDVIATDMILMENERKDQINLNISLIQSFLILDAIKKEWVQKNQELIKQFVTNSSFEYFVNIQNARNNKGVLSNFLLPN